MIDRLGQEPTEALLRRAVGLVPGFHPSLSCGLRLDGAVNVTDGWEEPFRIWHNGLGIGPRRCPLLAVGGSAAAIAIRVDRIDSAASWPEWRAVSLAHGRRSALALAVMGDRASLLVYSRSAEFSETTIESVQRIVRLMERILRNATTADLQ